MALEIFICRKLLKIIHFVFHLNSFKDMGTIIIGKIESGTVKRGESFTLMPNKVSLALLISSILSSAYSRFIMRWWKFMVFASDLSSRSTVSCTYET